MALKIPKIGLTQMLKDGYQHLQGLDEAVYRNIQATKELSQVVRTSLGPNGMNKMVINHLDKLFVTNDAATIIKELDVIHPAAKLLVMASQQQETEFGDNTNYVVVFAGQLLENAESLLRLGLHPSEIVEGYTKASAKTLQELEDISKDEIKDLKSEKELLKAVKSAIASKQYGYEDLISSLVVQAALTVMPKNTKNFNVDNVRVVKIMGSSIHESNVVKGMVFGKEPETTITKAVDSKVVVFTCPIDVATTETKGTVLIKNAEEMVNFSKGEEALLEKAIKEIADSGVKVVVTGAGIGDLALHFLNRYNLMAVKVLSKFDLRRLCSAIGATALARLGAPTPEEMGHVDVVEALEIGGDRVTVFKQLEENSQTATIVIRGGTKNLLDDLERAVDDGVNVVKALSRDPRILPGAGAVDLELAMRLSTFADKTPGLEQYAIKKYAESLEVVPKTLAENSGLDSTVLLSKLYAAHQNGNINAGVDIESEDNGILDAKERSIFDVLSIRHSAIKLATDAALTVLRVDQIIMSKPSGGPKVKENKNWDED